MVTQQELRARTRTDLLRRRQVIQQQQPQLTQAQIEEQVRDQMQREQETQLSNLQRDIETVDTQIRNLREQQAATTTEKTLERLDTSINRLESRRGFLAQAQGEIRKGFSAASVAAATAQRIERASGQFVPGGRPEPQLSAETIRKFEQQGLTPIISGGRITGFSDVIRQQSFTVENLDIIGETRLKKLEEAGLIKLETLTTTTEGLPPEVPFQLKPEVKEFVEDIKRLPEKRIPIIGQSLFELVRGGAVRTKIITLPSGERATVPIDFDETKVRTQELTAQAKAFDLPISEVPSLSKANIFFQKFTLEPKVLPPSITITPDKLEQIKQTISQLKLKGRITFGNLFIKDDDLRPLTGREIAVAVSLGLLSRAPIELGKLPFRVLGQAFPSVEETIVTIPKVIAPQRVTIGGLPSTLPGKPIQEPLEFFSTLESIGGFIGGLAAFAAPAPVLLAGGASILTGPPTVVTPEERLFGGLLFGAGAVKTVSFLRTPIVEKVPIRPLKTSKFQEKAITVIKDGKPVRRATFKIKGETVPPIEIKVTNRFRQLFNLRPKFRKVIPAKEFSIQTTGPTIGEQPFTVVQVKSGQKFGTFFRITGESIPQDLASWNLLSPKERFLWQRLAERIAGRPVSLRNTPNFLSKNSAKVKSFIESQELGRVNIATKTLELKDLAKIKIKNGKIEITTVDPTGKTITRTESVSDIRTILETEKIKVADVKTFFKDVTFPNARAIGTTPSLEGKILEFKTPIVLDAETSGVKILTKADITKTPFSKTFQEQVTKQVVTPTALRVPLPQVKPVTPTITVTEAPPITIPGAVPGVTTPSLFTGGLTPPDEEIIITEGLPPLIIQPTFPTPSLQPGITTISPIQVEKVKTMLDIKPSTKVSQIEELQLKTQLKQQELLKTPSALRTQTQLKELIKTQTQLRGLQALKTQQIQKQKLKLQQEAIQQARQRFKPPKITIPGIKIPFTLFRALPSEVKKKVKRKLMKAFLVQIRREGKWKTISTETLPKGKALKLGAQRVISDLSASFRLIPKGTTTKKDITFRPTKTHFRAPKDKAKLTFVERKNLRLKKGSEEISEILKNSLPPGETFFAVFIAWLLWPFPPESWQLIFQPL